MTGSGPRVFISYSHDSEEHRAVVLSLCERLRKDGISADLDQYVKGTPSVGWPRWMRDRLQNSDFVILVCTENYYQRFWGEAAEGRGVSFEGAIVTQDLYGRHGENTKFIPVTLAKDASKFVPEQLRATTSYELTSEVAYQALYDYLLGQSGIEPASVGEPRRRARPRGSPLEFPQQASSSAHQSPSPPAGPSSMAPATTTVVSPSGSTSSRPSGMFDAGDSRHQAKPSNNAAGKAKVVGFARRSWPVATAAAAILTIGIIAAARLAKQTVNGFSPGCEPDYRGETLDLGLGSIEFVRLPGGSFVSCAGGVCQDQSIDIKPFEMSRTEVSQAQFFDYVRALREKEGTNALSSTCWARDSTKPASWRFPNEDIGQPPTRVDGRYPVVCITQEEAKGYAEWLSGKLKARVRLPTAIEWEYAATSAGKCRPFSWGNAWPPAQSVANIADATALETLKYQKNEQPPLAAYRDGFAYSAPVGTFPPNHFGLFDMTGNVYEWVDDQCFVYGGSWDTGDGRLTETTHPHEKSRCVDRFSATGFRLVRELN